MVWSVKGCFWVRLCSGVCGSAVGREFEAQSEPEFENPSFETETGQSETETAEAATDTEAASAEAAAETATEDATENVVWGRALDAEIVHETDCAAEAEP